MNIVVVKELKPYTRAELINLFKIEDSFFNDFINTLSLMNILRKVSSTTNEFSLDELLEIENFLILDGIDNMYIFKFVGIVTILDTCLIVYPKYLTNYLEDSKNKYNDFKLILKVIRKYNFREQNQTLDANNYINLLPLAFELLTDYIRNGLYQNNRYIIEKNGNGEILWNETILNNTSYIIDDIPYYLDTFTNNNEINQEEYFRKLHQVILTQISQKFENILQILDFNPIYLSYQRLESFGSKDYIINRINQELPMQFITRNQNVLNIMKNYLLDESSRSGLNGISFIGTNSFNMVWQNVCSKVMQDCSNMSLKELGINYKEDLSQSTLIKEIIKKPTWVHNESKKEHEATKTIMPDLIVIKDNKFSIYDAKYYNIILNDKEVKNQPGVSDIIKQYLYALSYKNFIKEANLSMYENAFLLPFDKDEEIELGRANFEIFNDIIDQDAIKDIKIILKPCTKMYKEYLNK